MNVDIPFGENNEQIAVLLLAAAAKLDLDQSVVLTTSDGFSVPEEVANEAGVSEPADAPDGDKAEPKKTSKAKK